MSGRTDNDPSATSNRVRYHLAVRLEELERGSSSNHSRPSWAAVLDCFLRVSKACFEADPQKGTAHTWNHNETRK